MISTWFFSGGSARKKKVNVKRLIGSAKKLLAVAENNMGKYFFLFENNFGKSDFLFPN